MDHGLVELLRDLCEPLGGIVFKRMFGGCGLMADGRMFAMVIDDTFWLKVDDENAPLFEARGLERFAYTTKTGRRTVMSYARAPEELFDDPDLFLDWARRSIAAARRSEATPKRPRRARTTRPTAADADTA